VTTRLRVATSGTMPATADDIGGVGAVGQILGRIANAIPGLVDDVAWITAIPLATNPPVNVSRSAAQVGIDGSSARADHKHDVDIGVPTQVIPGQAALQGAGPGLALSDHQHAMSAFAVPVAIGTANSQGAADTFVRSDHVHAFTYTLLAAAYAANWSVTDWYIDGSIGNDANNGTTALTPLQTGAELARRLGPYALFRQSVRIHVLANGMIDALTVQGAMLVAGTQLDVLGVATVLATDTIATFAAVNHATPTATVLTATGIADWTAYRWRRIRVTSGARSGAVCWIGEISPGGVGLGTAQVCPPCNLSLTSTANVYVSTVALVAGDPFVVESLPQVPSISLQIDGPILETVGPLYDRRQAMVRDISVAYLDMRSTSRMTAYRTICYGCRLSRWNVNTTNVANTNTMTGVWGASFYESGTNTTYQLFANASNCLFGENYTSVTIANSINLQNALFQACPLSSFYAPCTLANIQVFGVVGAALAAISLGFGLGSSVLGPASGARNAGFGLQIYNLANLYASGTINLQGAVSNGRHGSTAVNLTLPQLLQPDDYAQKGTTAAMVAGVTVVTVPWYNNATQKVVATHATVAGTQGILSVTQTSTTQFTITSSSALDTSTVNWQISPLGQNIFIQT
jgi:hypothetical protein